MDRESKLRFIDITAENFSPDEYGHTLEELLARIHARRADGVIVDGPEVFRLALAAVGYGWTVAPTRWPLLRSVTEVTYRWFARNRSRLAFFYSRWIHPDETCDTRCQVKQRHR
jgi:predicted DCC family thiol-disulfide oxidoreductase YuxK